MKELSSIQSSISEISITDESFISVLNNLSSKENLINTLTEILNDDLLLAIIASRSYNHSNGFYKIMLFSSEEYKLRLHIWYPSSINSIVENIHYHRWRFVSKILIGEYTCFDYEPNSEGVLMYSYYYFPRDGRDTYDLRKAGQERIKLIGTKVLSNNDFLVSKPKELHRVIPNRQVYTVSLLIQGKDELEYTMVYNENTINETVNSPTLPKDELVKVLLDFKSHFSK